MALVQKELKNAYIGSTPAKRIMMRPNGVEKQVRPSGWQPDPTRTILYLKFNNNLDDSSGNGVVVSGAGLGYGTVGNNHYAEMTASGSGTYITPNGTFGNQIGTGDFCVSLWGYPITTNSDAACFFMNWDNRNAPWTGIFITYGRSEGFPSMSLHTNDEIEGNMPANQWMYMCFTRINGVVSGYINGQRIGVFNSPLDLTSIDTFYILNRRDNSRQQRAQTGAKVSEVIYEKVGWTDQEVLDYYNQTKSNYGL